MNDIARQRISERVIEALKKEDLSKNESGPMLGIHPSYLSCVCNPAKLNKCPDAAWEMLQKWVNSGLTIKGYSEKHYRVLSEKIVPKTKETISEPLKIDANLHDLATYPRQNVAGELVYKEKITLINLLQERRRCLVEETNAIDNLLRHYDFLMPQ